MGNLVYGLSLFQEFEQQVNGCMKPFTWKKKYRGKVNQCVLHETTPIPPTAEGGYRDTLALTFRRCSFLEDISTRDVM